MLVRYSLLFKSFLKFLIKVCLSFRELNIIKGYYKNLFYTQYSKNGFFKRKSYKYCIITYIVIICIINIVIYSIYGYDINTHDMKLSYHIRYDTYRQC